MTALADVERLLLIWQGEAYRRLKAPGVPMNCGELALMVQLAIDEERQRREATERQLQQVMTGAELALRSLREQVKALSGDLVALEGRQRKRAAPR